jgi:uncharacterized delta-60 repeat protein
MRNETEGSGLGATMVGATVLVLALALSGGCGGDETDPPITPQPDGGSNPPDGGTTTDGGVTPSADTEFAAVRFNSDGTRDSSFGTNGVAHVDLSTGTASAREALWGLQRDATDRLVLFGLAKATADRSDTDRVVVRLTANGALDDSFATKGVHTLNMSNLSDQGRAGIVQADGKIVASGYLAQPTGVGAQTANRIVLMRLDEAGALDNSFGVKGVLSSAPLQPANPTTTEWGTVEAYGVGRQSTGKYVTTGYGRAASTGTVDLLSFRYTASGELDTSWGTNGSFILNVVGDNDRGRNMVVLPDDRVFMVGSGVPAAQNIDAMTVMLTPEGRLDTSFHPDGYQLHGFGRADEAFYGVAVSPAGDRVAAAGYIAGGTEDEDALLYVRPIGSGTGNEFVQPVPISESSNDRFWAVTFDSAGKVYAAGMLTENGDSRMIVARFNPDGSKDTSFGTNGVAIANVVVAGTDESARGIVIQSDGKVVIAGVAEKR